jgi:hypothetical protein
VTAKETRIAQYHDLIRKATTDSDFRATLLDDPAAVLKAEGWDVPETMEVCVVENTDERMYITLPPLSVLTDDEMQEVTAGSVSVVSQVSKVSRVSIAPQ